MFGSGGVGQRLDWTQATEKSECLDPGHDALLRTGGLRADANCGTELSCKALKDRIADSMVLWRDVKLWCAACLASASEQLASTVISC